MTTANKGLAQPASASLNWDVPLNNNFAIIDNALGGNATINVTAASGTIALTSAQYQNLYLIFTGTLTANVNYQIPAGVGGQWTVYNNSTGAFTITISSAGGGSTVTTEQSKRSILVCDGTNIATSVTAITTPLPVASGGTGVTTSTGTGSVVLSNSPALVTPTLSSPVLTSATLNNPVMTTPTLGVASATSLAASGVVTAANGTSGTQVVNYSQFGSSLGAFGYTRLPNGFLMQWGNTSTSSGSGTITFPIAFTTACYCLQFTINGGTSPANQYALIAGVPSTTSVSVYSGVGSTIGFYWLAIGV